MCGFADHFSHCPGISRMTITNTAVAAGLVDELHLLGAAGCTYVQLDDINLRCLCDEKMREGVRQRGNDPDELPRRYARLINDAIANKPKARQRYRPGVAGHEAVPRGRDGPRRVGRRVKQHR